MIIKSLALKNFRKFKDGFIEFPDGVTAVIGFNGVGKSSLFEALAWVLYGSVASRTPTDQIKRQGAALLDPCRVELEFVFDDDNYRVVREMSGKNLTASGNATVNGKIAASGAEVVSRYIQKKLGMDWKSFYTSIFAKQKELNTLSSMNPSERRQMILRMLGIDAVDTIISKIRSDLREKRVFVEKIQYELVDENNQEKTLVYRHKIQTLERQKKELAKQIEEQKKKRKEIDEELLKAKEHCEKLKRSYEKLGAEKEQLEQKKSVYEKKKRLEEDITTLEKTINERQQQIENSKQKLTVFKTLENDLLRIQQQQQKNEDALQLILKKQIQNTTLLDRCREDIKGLTVKKKHIQKMGPDAKCPTCERLLGQQYSTLLRSYGEELIKKETEILKLTENEKNIKLEHEQALLQKQALQKKTHYLSSREKEQMRLQTSLVHESEELQRDYQKLKNKKKQHEEIGPMQFNQTQYTLLRSRVNEAYSIYQQSLLKIDAVKEKHQQISIQQKEQDGESKLLSQQIITYERNIKDLEKLSKSLTTAKKEAQHLAMLSEIMDSYRTYLISQIRPTLSSHASELFEQLTDGKYSQIELDENYNLLVYDHGLPYNIQRFSGGEEDLANLCIRLAISEIITERAGSIFQFIILDEIFGSQDQIRKQNIIKALNGFSSKFRQIFLITHVEEIKHFTEHTISVLEEENEISTLKVK